MISLKNPTHIAKMRDAGKILREVEDEVRLAIRPGVSTLELDELAERLIRKNHAIPSSLHYEGYPCSICASLNDEVVHGIPNAKRILLGVNYRSGSEIVKKSLRLISRNANDAFDEAFWRRRLSYAWNYRKTVMRDDISACLIAGGRILQGWDDYASELGHMTVAIDDDEVCSCGSRGCLERRLALLGEKINYGQRGDSPHFHRRTSRADGAQL